MDLTCEERPSDSPSVECVWRSCSERAAAFISMAEIHCGLVVTKYRDRINLTVRGPETRATPANGLAGAEFFGIIFKTGVFMPDLPPTVVMDRKDANLPEATSKAFWLHGSAWQFPDFENADTFVEWLVRDGLVVQDPVVGAVLRGKPVDVSSRTVQRHFLQATGLTQSDLHQIERARYATALLREGISILDTIHEAGYFDQPHLTRSLKHFIGLTPAQIISTDRSEQLSFLYKTASPFLSYATTVPSLTKER